MAEWGQVVAWVYLLAMAVSVFPAASTASLDVLAVKARTRQMWAVAYQE
jgi:hypothetical protein